MKKIFAVVFVAITLSVSGCNKKAPTVSPTTPVPDKVLTAAQTAGNYVAAVQAAEATFYASGASHISAADQQTVQNVFAKTSQTVLTAIQTYSAAKSAANQQALVSAITSGVNAIVTSFANFSDAQFKTYSAWVSAAVDIITLVTSGVTPTGGVNPAPLVTIEHGWQLTHDRAVALVP